MDIRIRPLSPPGSTYGTFRFTHRDNINVGPDQNYERITQGSSDSAFSHISGFQITESENHADWNRRDKRLPFKDSGGPFTTSVHAITAFSQGSLYRHEITQPLPWYPEWELNDTYQYTGPLLPIAPNFVSWPTDIRSSDDDLNELGTTAIAKCSPSNPSVDLSIALGELFHEGIPALIGGTLKELKTLSGQQRRRAAGHEYLNLEFGWKPLVADLMRFARSIVDADAILKSYERDSGRLVRRQYRFPPVLETNVSTILTDCSPWLAPSSNTLVDSSRVNQGKVVVTRTVERQQWFSGAFTYYVPPSSTMRNDIARQVILARKLLGLSLTPDVLWNLSPWSWAVDWFFNVGDVLSNWTDWAIDNQVLAYGYIMEKSKVSDQYTFVGPTGLYPSSVRPSDLVLSVETKLRRKATPYGFGLEWDGFSDRQKAIVAALGISRSK